MSISRALFNEFRPFFRLLEDPFSLSPSTSTFTRDPFFSNAFNNFNNFASARPALNLSEAEDRSYVVEAELPGVKKENLDVKIGDGGRSLTIEGRVLARGSTQSAEVNNTAASTSTPTPAADSATPAGDSTAVTKSNDNNAVAPANQGNWSTSRTFTRTVWLPHPINTSSINAKLEDGILTIRAGKANQEATPVNVD